MSSPIISDPATTHTRRTLVESMGISAVDFRCFAGVESERPEKPNPTHSIVFGGAYETNDAVEKTKPVSSVAIRRQRELCEAVKAAVNARIESIPSLAELAQSLDCSPFHLSRTFRRMTGVSLRRYVTRLRTSMAADRLENGAKDLTDLALDLGFADHSHFTNTFRKKWGVPPSRFRSRLSFR